MVPEILRNTFLSSVHRLSSPGHRINDLLYKYFVLFTTDQPDEKDNHFMH